MNKVILSAVLLSLSTLAVANDTPPSLDPKNCVFSYPRGALMNEEQGIATVKVNVDSAGNVIAAELVKSSGSKSLDKATVSVVNTCKFKPGTKEGKAAEATTIIKYEWSLTK